MKLRRAFNWPLAIYLFAILLVTVQKGLMTGDVGNYILFRDSFYRLISGADVYNYTPPRGQIAGFLYSPTFALLFAPFAILPLSLGLLLWNSVNALAVYYGITRLLPPRAARLALAIVFLDVVRSLQNSQSNALVAGLMLLAFVALEQGREARAAAAVVAGAFIKIFPVAAGALAIFGAPPPGRRVRFLLWCVGIGLALAALPLLVLPPASVAAVYKGWYGIIQRDTGLRGQSVMRILSDWFGSTAPNWTIQLAGTLVLLAPVALRRDQWTDGGFRRLFLCSLLVFLVIFNHQAESPSFVIATCGIAIWYVSSRREWWRTALLAFTLLTVTVSKLFFFPYQVYHDLIKSYALDAFACLLVWLVMQAELWTWPRSHLAEVTERDVSAREPGVHDS